MAPLHSNPATQPLPQLQFLQQAEHGFVALPTLPSLPRQVYPLCPMPSSLVDWMVNASQSFWRDHQRCVSFALLFDPARQHWSIDLPRQHCLSTRAEWSASALPSQPPDYFLAGSFHSRPPECLPSPNDLPTFSGMHLVVRLSSHALHLHAFMRWSAPQECCQSVPTDLLFQNDYPPMLQSAAPRMALL